MQKIAMACMLLVLSASAWAGSWQVGALGNDQTVGARVLYDTGSQTRAGLETLWGESVTGLNQEGITVAAVGIWDVLPEVQFPVAGWLPEGLPLPESIPLGVSVGAALGFRVDSERDFEGVADVFVEAAFNPKGRVPIFVQFRHHFAQVKWDKLPSWEDADQILLGFEVKL